MDPEPAFGLAVEDGAIDLAHRHLDGVERDSPAQRCGGIEADVCDFGVGEGAARHEQVGDASAAGEERVAQYEA